MQYLFGGSAVDIAVRIGGIVLVIVALKFLYSYLSGYEERKKRNLIDKLVSNRNYLQAGSLYLQDNKILHALKMYMKGGHWARAAELHERLGEHEKAAKLFEKAGDIESASRSYLRLRKYGEAARCLSRSKDPRLLEKAARMLEDEGDFGKAAAVFESAGLYEQAANMQWKLGKEKKAHALMALHYSGKGDMPSAAQSLMDAGDFEGALQKLDGVVKQMPLSEESLDLHYRYALALEKSGRPLEALEIYDKIAGLDRRFMDVLMRMYNIRQAWSGIESPQEPGRAATKLQFAEPLRTDRYDVIREIGRGGMGVVYEAMDTRLGRLVALKVLHENYASNPTAGRFFLREARSAAQLNHPGIVTVYDFGTLGDRHFISMEYLEGETLEDILAARGKLRIAEFTDVADQVLSALGYAHEKSVIHRDLKPGNIMICTGRAKIMDFGLAKVVDEERKASVIAGTPQYMAIEQVTKKDIDHRTDIFALGVTFFELLTGELPFPDGIVAFPAGDAPPKAGSIEPSIPKKLERIVERMIRRTPEDRYGSVREVQEDMKTVAVYSRER